MRDDEAALAMLHQLRALGVRIALDDFGTGYSSLSYLQRFPFDKIKIDRSFIKSIAEEGASSAIVESVVNIAAASNMTTTAEGVEQEWQREMLRELGCTEMQGFLFSPAIRGRRDQADAEGASGQGRVGGVRVMRAGRRLCESEPITTNGRHSPATVRGIQYAAASRFNHCCSGILDRPRHAGRR